MMVSVVNINKCSRNQCKSFSNSLKGRKEGRKLREGGRQGEREGGRERKDKERIVPNSVYEAR